VPEGLPPPGSMLPTAFDLWQWLALLGGLGLFAEWILFGRRRKQARSARKPSTRLDAEGRLESRSREVVTK